MHPCDLLEQNLPLIGRMIASVCRRRAVYGEDTEDVRQEVLLKLSADDCAALGRLRDEGSFRTFVCATTTNLILDAIRGRKGRWRPSAVARSLGATAMTLERLLYRDGWEYGEAVERLIAEGMPESRAELDGIRARLPDRPPRRLVGEEAIADYGVADGVEEGVAEREREAIHARFRRAWERSGGKLAAEDRFILKRLFLSGRTVAQVAGELGVEQRPLYRRRDRILDCLREELEAEGLGWEEVGRLMGWDKLDLGWHDDGEGGGPEGAIGR